jgi:hypothetical protein
MAGEEVETSEHAKRVEPTDDENLGYVQVEAPSAATVDVVSRSAVSYQTKDLQSTTSLKIGEASRLRAGAGRVHVNGDLIGGSTPVDVVQAKTAKVMLAGAQLTFDPAPLEVDFGRKAVAMIRRTNDLGALEAGVVRESGLYLLLPGAYEFAYSSPNEMNVRTIDALAVTSKTFAAGAITSAALKPADVRATIVIKQPVRDFPDAVPGDTGAAYPNCHQRSLVIVQRADQTATDWSTGQVHSSRVLANDVAHSLRVFPFTPNEAAHYELVVNNIPVVVDAKPGQKTAVTLERIDVDDVAVTTEKGETRKVRGTYQLYREVGGSWSLVEIADRKAGCDNIANSQWSHFFTKTGIDVPSGKYKVVVSYDTAEQGNKSKEYSVTVP